MKRIFFLMFLSGIVFFAMAQTMHRPTFRPDWVFEAPRPSNGTYLYVVEHGEGRTKREALNQALGRVFQSTANRLGQVISTDEVNRAVQAGTDYEVIARNMKVPINKVCEFPVQDTLTNSWTMYVLCQVAKAGNIIPEFEATDECTKHTRFDAAMKKWESQQKEIEEEKKRAINQRNATALIASTFIPGMGQMIKGHAGAGTAFLISEVALFGGGTACYFLGQEQKKILQSSSTSYDAYMAAQKKKQVYDIAMWTTFGVGAAVHITNMVHAWLCPDKHLQSTISLAPTLIPTNEYSRPAYAMGVGVQYKF